jgi:hypothetical protein
MDHSGRMVSGKVSGARFSRQNFCQKDTAKQKAGGSRWHGGHLASTVSGFQTI